MRPLAAAIKGTDFDNLDLLPADFTYRRMDLVLDAAKKPTRQIARLLTPLAREYDTVFLDCPPSMSLVSENVLNAADTPDRAAHPDDALHAHPRPAHRAGGICHVQLPTARATGFVDAFDGRRPAIVAFFSMVDRRKRLHRDIVQHLPEERADIATATVPALSLIEQMAVRRAPLPAYAPRSKAACATASYGRTSRSPIADLSMIAAESGISPGPVSITLPGGSAG